MSADRARPERPGGLSSVEHDVSQVTMMMRVVSMVIPQDETLRSTTRAQGDAGVEIPNFRPPCILRHALHPTPDKRVRHRRVPPGGVSGVQRQRPGISPQQQPSRRPPRLPKTAYSTFFLKEHPSVRRALPPVGWQSTVEQPAQMTTV